MGKPIKGWNVPPMTVANFGTEYGLRAIDKGYVTEASLEDVKLCPARIVRCVVSVVASGSREKS
jgi:hypothetical protein